MDTIITFIRYHMLFSECLKNKKIEECWKLNQQYILANKDNTLNNIAIENCFKNSNITNINTQLERVQKKYPNIEFTNTYNFLSQHMHTRICDNNSHITMEGQTLENNLRESLECFIDCCNQFNDDLLERYRSLSCKKK
jgi:hypothetical protein